jgi:hypothetical protein
VSSENDTSYTNINKQSVPKKGSDLTSDWPFGEFRKDTIDFGWVHGYKALDIFKNLEDRDSFLEPTFDFVDREKNDDRVRSWGMSMLENIGGNRALRFIVEMFRKEKTRDEKRKYILTCFFALKAIAKIANSSDEKKELLAILKDMWNDEDEDYLAQAGASVILANQQLADAQLIHQAVEKIKDMLKKRDINITTNDDLKTSYWAPKWALRAYFRFR